MGQRCAADGRQHLDHAEERQRQLGEQASLATRGAFGRTCVGAATQFDVVAGVDPTPLGEAWKQAGDQQAAVADVAQGVRPARRLLPLPLRHLWS